jgi:hypothetical protein
VRRFIAALVFFDLEPIIRSPMQVAVMLKKCFALESKAVTSHRSPKKMQNSNLGSLASRPIAATNAEFFIECYTQTVKTPFSN